MFTDIFKSLIFTDISVISTDISYLDYRCYDVIDAFGEQKIDRTSRCEKIPHTCMSYLYVMPVVRGTRNTD